MKTIYVVKAVYEYDGSVDVRAFTTKQEALKLCEVLEAYRMQEPAQEEGESEEEYWARKQEWIEESPGDICCACDYFVVMQLELEGE